MKIAQVVSTFLPYRAGIGNVAFNNAKQLAKFEHDITIITPRYKGTKKDEEMYNFKIKRFFRIIRYGNASFIPQIYNELKQYDIIHLHYPFFGGAEIVYLFKLLNPKKKLIITYHHDTIGKGWLGWIFKIYNKILIPLILKSADEIIVTTMDYARHSMISPLLKKHSKKFIEVPLGVDENFFIPKKKSSELLKKYHFTEKSRIAIFVGALDKAHYFKGVENLIVAFKRVLDEGEYQDIHLIIAGGGNMVKEYKDLAYDAETHNQIIFTGKIEKNTDLVEYINLGDLLILPSIDSSEAFGLVLVEAMACGKAILASDLPGVRTLVEEGKNGYLLIPKNINDIEDKLTKLLINTDLLKKYGLYGRQKVENKYSWTKIGEKLNLIICNQ